MIDLGLGQLLILETGIIFSPSQNTRESETEPPVDIWIISDCNLPRSRHFRKGHLAWFSADGLNGKDSFGRAVFHSLS